MKKLTIVGGSHGAGKSTYCRELVAERGWVYLTNQEVRRQHARELERAEVHHLLHAWVETCLSTGAPFIFEHIMSGRYADRLIQLAADHGYSMELVYLDISDAALAHRRVDQRVATGGHDVEREKVERRLRESRANFWNNYRHRADRWLLLDTSGAAPSEIARGEADSLQVLDHKRFARFVDRVGAPSPGADAPLRAGQGAGRRGHSSPPRPPRRRPASRGPR